MQRDIDLEAHTHDRGVQGTFFTVMQLFPGLDVFFRARTSSR